jgi:hypothetical protein
MTHGRRPARPGEACPSCYTHAEQRGLVADLALFRGIRPSGSNQVIAQEGSGDERAGRTSERTGWLHAVPADGRVGPGKLSLVVIKAPDSRPLLWRSYSPRKK